MKLWRPNPNPKPDQITLSYIINRETLDVVWVEGRNEDIKEVAGKELNFSEVDWSKFKIAYFDNLFGCKAN